MSGVDFEQLTGASRREETSKHVLCCSIAGPGTVLPAVIGKSRRLAFLSILLRGLVLQIWLSGLILFEVLWN